MLPLLALLGQAGIQITAEVASAIVKEGVQWLKEAQAKQAIKDEERLKIATEMLEVANHALEVRAFLLQHPDAVDFGVLVREPLPVPGEGHDPQS